MKPWPNVHEETWTVSTYGRSYVVQDQHEATIGEWHEVTGANQARETAALIAAAPEMYRALEAILDMTGDGSLRERRLIDDAYAALAKARGER